jgi:hypothetical protein
MNYFQITEIKNALIELGKERLPVAYEIAKNTRLCNQVINETADLSRELFEKFADRDSEGALIQYPDESKSMQTVLKINDPEKLAQHQAERIKLLLAEHTVDFVKISASSIQAVPLTASILMPLLDSIIE